MRSLPGTGESLPVARSLPVDWQSLPVAKSLPVDWQSLPVARSLPGDWGVTSGCEVTSGSLGTSYRILRSDWLLSMTVPKSRDLMTSKICKLGHVTPIPQYPY